MNSTVLGFLFIAAGIGYLFDTTSLLLVTSYTATTGLSAMVITVAGTALPIWLRVQHANMRGWQRPTPEAVYPQSPL